MILDIDSFIIYQAGLATINFAGFTTNEFLSFISDYFNQTLLSTEKALRSYPPLYLPLSYLASTTIASSSYDALLAASYYLYLVTYQFINLFIIMFQFKDESYPAIVFLQVALSF